MTDKALDKIEEDLGNTEESEESEKPEKTENTGNNGNGGNSGNKSGGGNGKTGNTGNTGDTGNNESLPPADDTLPPDDGDGYMSDEEYNNIDWTGIDTDAGDDPTAQGDSDTNGTIIAY